MTDPITPRLRPGLCSVSFRALPPAEIIELSAAAGLEAIEWGAQAPWSPPPGDPEYTTPHVTVGDLDAARELGDRTRDAGLAVASFGSYLNFTEATDAASRQASEQALDTTVALGAPRIRVWAGRQGSDEASPGQVDTLVRRLTDCVALADERGVEVGLEYHGGSLTDTLASTLLLLDAVPGLTSYWQPRVDASDAEAVDDLATLGDRSTTLHVFSWWPGATRLPLAGRERLWRDALATAHRLIGDRDALLEFVPGDDPRLLAREATHLRTWIAEATNISG